jgi:Flagellar biosynthesis protein, FliO
MEFFDDLSVPVKFLIAFVVALATLGVGGYLMRRLTGPRGSQPGLAVINAAGVDGRRRLVLVRRDNVEHLLLIGGPREGREAGHITGLRTFLTSGGRFFGSVANGIQTSSRCIEYKTITDHKG